MGEYSWNAPPERLDRAVAAAGMARSRSQAQALIAAGQVLVNGQTAVKAGEVVASGSTIEVLGADHYVSRAAHKLNAGLDTFEVAPGGRLALDLGASTGGFTQVLLERGARTVIALDVGHDQLAAELRADQRVRVVEGCNARELTAQRLAELSGIEEPPTLIVSDLSFISLTLVLPAIANVAAPHAELVLLIKPQFEVGRTGIRAGIVRDPHQSSEAIDRVLACATALGLTPCGVTPSPLTGEHGNQEFLAYFVQGGAA